MLTGFLIWYFLGKYALIIFTLFCFYTSVQIFNSAMRFYYPKMKNKDLQHFHDKYPEFIRIDLPTITLGRIFFHTFSFVWIKTVTAVFFTGGMMIALKNQDPETTYKDEYFPIIKMITRFNMMVMYSMGVLDVSEKEINPIDVYRKYLGPDYVPPTSYSTIILNHTNWIDIVYFLGRYSCSFVSKASVRSYFLIGFIARAVRCLFLDRTNKENRSDTFGKIVNTQNMIMEGKISGKLCIFPEGATSNGKYLLSFKKGAFASLTPLKPFITKGRGNSFDMSFGSMNISLHCYISLCYLYHSLDINELPVIAPTEYLFENYKHLGKDKVEIFQEGVKAIISEVGGFKKSSLSYDRKFEYLSEIHEKVVKNT